MLVLPNTIRELQYLGLGIFDHCERLPKAKRAFPTMPDSSSYLVFISHAQEDKNYANELQERLAQMGIAAWNFSTAIGPGDDYLEKARFPIQNCSHILVLIGSNTKDSQWVDMEMQIATAARSGGPGASIIGLILPEHRDFKTPYYEPKRIPFRLHDMVLREAATVKKWTTDQGEIRSMLDSAARRRSVSGRPTRPSLSVLEFVRQKAWSDLGDVQRAGLESLSAEHPGR